MRAWCVLTLLFVVCGFVVAQDKPVTKKEATSLVEEYLGENTPAGRRSEIIQRLKRADAGLAATPLKKAAGDEAKVGLAVEMALALRVGGLFKPAAKFMDGDYEDVITNYGLALGEKGAAEAVWERWKAKDPDGTSWSIANTALLKHPIPLSVIEDVKKFLASADDDDLQRRPAGNILRFQLGLGGIADDKIIADWKAILSSYKLDSKAFSLSGQDLLQRTDWTKKGPVVRVANNLRLVGGTAITVPATDEWDLDSLTFVVRVRVVQACEVKIALHAEQGAWMPHWKDGEWLLEAGDTKQWAAPGVLGEWTEVRFVVAKSAGWAGKGAELRKARTCRVTVGDAVLIDNGSLNGDWKDLEVWVEGDSGLCAIGGMELSSN